MWNPPFSDRRVKKGLPPHIDMACGQAKPTIQNQCWEPSIPKNRGKQPQGNKNQQALRKSLHLQTIRQSQFFNANNHIQKVPTSPFPLISNIPASRKPSQIFHNPSTSSRKRKRGRGQEAEHLSSRSQKQRLPKRVHMSPLSCIDKKKSHYMAASSNSEGSTDPLEYWIKTGRWRKEYFEQNSEVREDFERGKSSKTPGRRESFRNMPSFSHLHLFFARKKSSASLRRKQSQSTIQTSYEQPSREAKSSQYNSPDYVIKLERKGSYMREHDDIDDDEDNGKKMKTFCKTLMGKDQTVPQDSLFRNDLFKKICRKVENKNEAIVFQDITRLLVPSAMNLAIYGAEHLNHLYETVNESWTNMIEFEGTLPQPDYSVGFGQSAFTSTQLNKLKPFVGELGSKINTYFMATSRMYFPFITCEVKCGAIALDIADRQNAQSMSIALRALVVLFRCVKREEELDREILTFSISHDHTAVRIYGHYSVIEGNKTTFFRHPIRKFDFTDGEEKWTAYKFTKNVYDIYMPKLHKLICSAIDDLPDDTNFDIAQSVSFFQSTPQSSQQSNTEPVLDEDSQSSFLASHEVTPTTSFTQRIDSKNRLKESSRHSRNPKVSELTDSDANAQTVSLLAPFAGNFVGFRCGRARLLSN